MDSATLNPSADPQADQLSMISLKQAHVAYHVENVNFGCFGHQTIAKRWLLQLGNRQQTPKELKSSAM